jgi:membrane-bound ClpP family serine protease
MLTLGIALLVVGLALLVAEAHLPALGALGAAGTAALVAGGVLTVIGSGGGFALALPIGIGAGLAAGGFLYILLRKGLELHGARARSGTESLVGHVGVIRSAPDPLGQVFVDGALWRARSSWWADEGVEALHEGDPVIVEQVSGLTLSVRRAEEWELMP